MDGDTFAPELGEEWVITHSTGRLTAPTGVAYVVEDLRKRDPAG